MTRSIAALITVALLGGSPAPSRAQDAPHAVCFRARPADRCRGFLITEFAALAGPTARYRSPPVNVVWDLGYAHHLGRRTALGATLTVIADDQDRVTLGVRPRLRRWLGPHTSLDIAPAILVGRTDADGLRMRYPGLSTYVGVGWRDLVALNAQFEVIRLAGGGPTETVWLFGLRLGSYAGLAAGPLGAAFVAYARSFGDD